MQRQHRPSPIKTGRRSQNPELATPLTPNEFNTVNFKNDRPAKTPTTPRFFRPDSDTLLDRKSVNVAGMLTHFKSLIMLATTPAGDGESKEVAAAHALQMEVETNALVLDLADLQ